MRNTRDYFAAKLSFSGALCCVLSAIRLTHLLCSFVQIGFHVGVDGIVTDVEGYAYAWQAGLRQNFRIVEICKVAIATLDHDQIIDLLRTSITVTVTVLGPHADGSPRRLVLLIYIDLRNERSRIVRMINAVCARSLSFDSFAAGYIRGCNLQNCAYLTALTSIHGGGSNGGDYENVAGMLADRCTPIDRSRSHTPNMTKPHKMPTTYHPPPNGMSALNVKNMQIAQQQVDHSRGLVAVTTSSIYRFVVFALRLGLGLGVRSFDR